MPGVFLCSGQLTYCVFNLALYIYLRPQTKGRKNVNDGFELKIMRMRERVKQADLAQEMGISQVRVSNIEAKYSLSKDITKRFMDGLERVKASR
jgi:DNA-binding XRE family transcriptional regulator